MKNNELNRQRNTIAHLRATSENMQLKIGVLNLWKMEKYAKCGQSENWEEAKIQAYGKRQNIPAMMKAKWKVGSWVQQEKGLENAFESDHCDIGDDAKANMGEAACELKTW